MGKLEDDGAPEIEADFPGNQIKDRIVKSETQSNSIRSREDLVPAEKKKKIQSVVKGKIYRRKKGFLENLSQTFFGEDTKNVGSYILLDVLIPAAKNTIQEMISSGLEMLLFGESRGSARRRDRDRGRSVTSYSSFYRSRNDNRFEDRRPSRAATNRLGVEEIIFERGDEAAEVLAQMEDLIENYDQVTVADYYDLAGYPDSNFTDNKYGWDNLERVRCAHVRGGYIIDLPRPIELD